MQAVQPSTIQEATILARTEADWAEEAAMDAEFCLSRLQERHQMITRQYEQAEEAVKNARRNANEALGLVDRVSSAGSPQEAKQNAQRISGCREQVEKGRKQVHEAIFA